jgi:hypothetical protein
MTIYSGFSHWKWWFSIVMLVYQRVSPFCIAWSQISKLHSFIPWGKSIYLSSSFSRTSIPNLPRFQCLSRLRAVSLCSSLPELFELWDAGASSAMRCRALEATELRCRPWADPWELGIIQPMFFYLSAIWPKIGDIIWYIMVLMVLNCDSKLRM